MNALTQGRPPGPNARGDAAPRGDSPSVRVAIVYHSGFGHTARQAEAVRAGVRRVRDAEALLIDVEQAPAHWGDLAAAAAIIFGTPTYMAGVSAAFKAFQESTSHAVLAQGHTWQDKIAAGFTNSGARAGDKLATLFQLTLFAAQHGMHWVNLGLPPANNSTSGSEAELNRLGFWLGAGAQSNVDEGPDSAPPEADLRTAEHLGWRVAETALRFARGQASLAAGQPNTAVPVPARAPAPVSRENSREK